VAPIIPRLSMYFVWTKRLSNRIAIKENRERERNWLHIGKSSTPRVRRSFKSKLGKRLFRQQPCFGRTGRSPHVSYTCD